MKKTIDTVAALHLKGAPVTSGVVNSIAKGIVMAHDRSILVEHGGFLTLSLKRKILYKMEIKGKKMATT